MKILFHQIIIFLKTYLKLFVIIRRLFVLYKVVATAIIMTVMFHREKNLLVGHIWSGQ